MSDGPSSCPRVMVWITEARLMFFRQPEQRYSRWRSPLGSIAKINPHSLAWIKLGPWAGSMHPTGLRRVPGREDQAGGDQTAAEERFHEISRVSPPFLRAVTPTPKVENEFTWQWWSLSNVIKSWQHTERWLTYSLPSLCPSTLRLASLSGNQ